MTIRRKILFIFIIIILLALGSGSYIMWQIGRTNNFLKTNVPQAIQVLSNTTHLNSLAEVIRYYDEVLTQSARNYAYTGDLKWKNRYNDNVPKLDEAIKEALAEGDEQDKQYFSDINESNLALVDMETRSLSLADLGQLKEAQAILDGQEYATQKAIYKDGLDKYLAKQGTATNKATNLSTITLNDANSNVQKMNSASATTLGIFILVDFLLIISLLYILFYNVIQPLSKLKEAIKKIADGDLEQKLEIKSNDEIGELTSSFNQMSTELRESKTNIEKKVTERTDDLEKLNKFMTGRELKMIELKEKIKDLENKNANKK